MNSAKNTLPKISVVIPVLNSVKTIKKALLSVIEQHYENMELIIIDAGSVDGTLEIIKHFSPFIYYWHSKPDGSTGHAINLGFQKASGDLIAQLMADDWFEPGTFHAIGQAFLKNPTVEVISCGGRIVRYDAIKKYYQPVEIYTSLAQLDLNFYTICFGIPAMSSRFLTKSLIDKIGGMVAFDANGKHLYSADRELLLRAAAHNSKHVIISHLGHSYLAHEASATFGHHKNIQLRIHQEHIAMAEKYLARQDLSQKQRSVLKHWYSDQSVRYLLHKIVIGDVVSVLAIAMDGIKKTGLQWVKSFFYVAYKIVMKKYGVKNNE